MAWDHAILREEEEHDVAVADAIYTARLWSIVKFCRFRNENARLKMELYELESVECFSGVITMKVSPQLAARRGAVSTLILCLILGLAQGGRGSGWTSAAYPAQTISGDAIAKEAATIGSGGVIEEISGGSERARAGLRVGDVVSSWERPPSQMAGSAGAGGQIRAAYASAPFYWAAFQLYGDGQ